MKLIRLKQKIAILGILLLGIFVCFWASALIFNERKANAQTNLNDTNATLFLPKDYEQYLELKKPVDVAVCDNYIAVADENQIYVFSRESGEYSVFTHGDLESVKINKIQFSDEGRLYFVNTTMHFYELALDSMTAENNLYSLSTFFISDGTLYAATSTGTTQLRKLALHGTEPMENITPFVDNLPAPPCITYADGILYYTVNNVAYEYNFATQKSHTFILDQNGNGSTQDNISSICAYGNRLYYTNPNGLFVSDKNGNATALIRGSSCSAVTIYNKMLYCVKEKSIVQYDIEAGTFTDYEISSASSSQNRLSGAGDCVRAGDLLVTADNGNNRISVYDFAEKHFITLPCMGVKSVATDGAIIAAATDSGISIYEKVWNEETLSREFAHTKTVSQANVAGVACVYDAIYFVTSVYDYGKIVRNGEAENGWAVSSAQRSVGTTPKAITADVFGDIFVAATDGSVYKLGEENFAATEPFGSPVANISGGFSSLRAGFDGTLYYLDGEGKLHSADGEIANIDGKEFVYTGDVSKHPTSFALGFEDDEVYFLFGDFIVKTNADALGLETLETVSKTVLGAAADELSSVHTPEEVSFAEIGEKKVGIHVNFGALAEEGALFGNGYTRNAEPRRGVLLAEHEGYSLVALYEDHVYSVELFRTKDVGEKVPAEYENADDIQYIASDCPPYHYPCITEAPARAATLPRGTSVRLLAVVHADGDGEQASGGYDFAYIEYETPARARVRGYVPLAYLTEVNPLGDAEETFRLGYVKPGATFTGSDGSELVNPDRVLARLYRVDDGTFRAEFTEDGVTYTATVAEKQIEWGESDALRIALIVILSVLAVVIIGAYIFLLPRDKKQGKK